MHVFRALAIAVFLLVMSGTVFAANLTIYNTGNTTSSSLVNTRTNLSVFNFSVAALDTDVSISGLNITISNLSSLPGGNITGGNISKIFVFNGSTSTQPVGTNSVLGINLATGNNVTVSFTTVINLTNGTSTNLLVAYEISASATSGLNIAGKLSGPGDVIVNSTTPVFANVSMPNSTISTIVDVHANASITPRFVDTNVENQTFNYIVLPTGDDALTRVSVNLPSGYTLINVNASTPSTGDCVNAGACTIFPAPNNFNVSLGTLQAGSGRINVTFTTNTSSSVVASAAFTSTVDGNVTNVATDVAYFNSTNVTTKALINVTNVVISKSTAVVNGSDYWEFNFTFVYNAPVIGVLQFKMSNWSDANGNILSIYNSTGGSVYASLRNNTNYTDTNGKMFVNNSYGSGGLSFGSSPVPLILRMIVPIGTPISSTWFTTYGFLFRASP